MTPTLPTGTVTFLFTDIEGSTRLAQEYPEALPALLARHNAILHTAIASNQGRVFRIAGDAFCAAFYTPRDAFSAALSAQRDLQHEAWKPAPIRVRMGLHTGEAQTSPLEPQSDPYVGYLTLTRVQRVMSTAYGEQILLSNSTAGLVRADLPVEVTLRDMGEHKLKGLVQPEKLYQVLAPDLRRDFAPLQTLDTIPSNLPAALNRLVGRERELKEVKQRLAETRLVTLLGPGGTGKTRLALQVASDLLGEFEERVYFVDLAPARDADAVIAAISRILGLSEKSDTPPLLELKRSISSKKMLFLLDNFEQVTVAGPVMADLLRDCSGLRLLVTSREALNVRGENVYPIPTLALPSGEAKDLSLEALAKYPAIQLFMERADAVKPGLMLTAENAAAIVEICERLDGLPLALELAAARLNVFTPQALAERLGNRLKLLRGGARDLPVRQQTLRDTIDWSYDLLDRGEQDLFQLLSVFSGATLPALEAVASALPRLNEDEPDVFEALGSLAGKSLVRQSDESNDPARFGMLETIREFAAACLAEDAAFEAAARRAHAAYFADFTASQWELLRGEQRVTALSTLSSDLANIQSAWNFWADEANLEQLAKFTDSLWSFYDARGWYHATIKLTTELLKILSTTADSPERTRQEIVLQTGLARALMATKGYSAEVEQAFYRALELCEGAGEIPELFPVLRGLSVFYILRGEFNKGAEMGRRILDLATRLGDRDMMVEGHLVIGENVGSRDTLPAAIAELEKGLALYDPSRSRARSMGLGSNPGVVSLIVTGLYSWMAGLPDRARRRAAEAIALARKLDHPFSLTYSLFHHGLLMHWLGEDELAQESARKVLDLADEHEYQVWTAAGSSLLGSSLARKGMTDEGLELLQDGIKAYRGLKSPPVFLPLLLYLNATALGQAGRTAEALECLEAAFAASSPDANPGLAAEFLRLQGDLMLATSRDNAPQVESVYQLGTGFAQKAEAKIFELRIATRLGRLWQSQGKAAEARVLLDEIYGKFTEGFDTIDLKTAKELLTELSD